MGIDFDPDPDRYARMSEPFESMDEANAALDKFFKGVEALREECGLPHVFSLVEVFVQNRDRRAVASQFLGNLVYKLPLLARAYGEAREQYERELADIMVAAREDYRRRMP